RENPQNDQGEAEISGQKKHHRRYATGEHSWPSPLCRLNGHPARSRRNGCRRVVHFGGRDDRSAGKKEEYRGRTALLRLVGRIFVCLESVNNTSQSPRR